VSISIRYMEWAVNRDFAVQHFLFDVCTLFTFEVRKFAAVGSAPIKEHHSLPFVRKLPSVCVSSLTVGEDL